MAMMYNDDPKTFREALDLGLRRGINTLIQDKLEGLSSSKGYSDISSRIQKLGVPQEHADYLATLPHQYQVPLLQEYFQNRTAEQPGSEQSMGQELEQLDQGAPIETQQPAQRPLPASSRERQLFQHADRRKQEQDRKISLVERHKADKETLPYYNQLKKESKGSKENLQRLNRMEQLIKKGNLPTSGWSSLFDSLAKGIWGVGINLKPLYHADAQEFEKISNDFVKNAKDVFGGRLTDADLKVFMSTVPTLSLSNAGKMRVINNLRYANEANQVRDKIAEDIIKANGGRRPINLQALVEEMAGPRLDVLAQKFKEENIPEVREAEPFQLAGKPARGLPGLF